MRRDVNKVSSWDFDRIITCHGVRPASIQVSNTC
jgi:hypothetical protein